MLQRPFAVYHGCPLLIFECHHCISKALARGLWCACGWKNVKGWESVKVVAVFPQNTICAHLVQIEFRLPQCYYSLVNGSERIINHVVENRCMAVTVLD